MNFGWMLQLRLRLLLHMWLYITNFKEERRHAPGTMATPHVRRTCNLTYPFFLYSPTPTTHPPRVVGLGGWIYKEIQITRRI
jgi:hypothetical protein